MIVRAERLHGRVVRVEGVRHGIRRVLGGLEGEISLVEADGYRACDEPVDGLQCREGGSSAEVKPVTLIYLVGNECRQLVE